MSYQEFKNTYTSKTIFLQFYQVVNAIPKYLATKAKNTVPPESEPYTENNPFSHVSLHQGSTESGKTLEQKFIFQIGTLNFNDIKERFSFN